MASSRPVPPAASGAAVALAFDAVVFDMDGVVTETAAVHAAAWKQMFDEYLRARERIYGEPFREFSSADYRAYVDGKPRYQGVSSFLESRAIHLPWGAPANPAGSETVCGLGNRKNEAFNAVIATQGVAVFPSTVALIRELLAAGAKVGLATSSRNAALILGHTPAAPLFGTIVDGLVSERLGLKGKPSPDIFLTAAANLGVLPSRTIVVEDAVSGVRAGAAGGFALVVGIAREHNADELRANGADVVVADLAETNLAQLDQCVREKRESAR